MGRWRAGVAGAVLLGACYATHPEEPLPSEGPAPPAPLGVPGAAGEPSATPTAPRLEPDAPPDPPEASGPPVSRPGLDPGRPQSAPNEPPSGSCAPGERRSDVCSGEVQALCAERRAVAVATCQFGGFFSQCTCELLDDPAPLDGEPPDGFDQCVETSSTALRRPCAGCLCATATCTDALLSCDTACWSFLRCALPCIDGESDPANVDCLGACFSFDRLAAIGGTAEIPNCMRSCLDACTPALRDDAP